MEQLDHSAPDIEDRFSGVGGIGEGLDDRLRFLDRLSRRSKCRIREIDLARMDQGLAIEAHQLRLPGLVFEPVTILMRLAAYDYGKSDRPPS